MEHAEAYAGQAAIALANAQDYWEQASLAQNLAKALESRSVIEQANGVIIATSGVDAETAFDLLRQQSQAENRKLRELAAEIVDRHVRRHPRPPGAERLSSRVRWPPGRRRRTSTARR